MWVETTSKICIEIRKQHKKDLCIFGSYTDIEGDSYEWSTGCPEVMTEWGFKGAGNPLYKVVMSKEFVSDKDWKYEYFLYADDENVS